MKKLLFLLSVLTLFACNDVKNAKYKKGDIVYIKPDNKRGVVWDVKRCGYMYSISFDAGSFWLTSVDEDQISHKEK